LQSWPLFSSALLFHGDFKPTDALLDFFSSFDFFFLSSAQGRDANFFLHFSLMAAKSFFACFR